MTESLQNTALRLVTAGQRRSFSPRHEEVSKGMLLLILLAVLAIVLFGLGFTLHWLFIIAVIAALVFLIMLFMGGAGGRTRGAWW